MQRSATRAKATPAKAVASAPPSSRAPAWAVALLLVLATAAIYWPATRCDFVNYDDNLHVTANVQVQQGLTWESLKWAFSHPVNSNWHPLTLWSHMADCQLFGLNPWGHHLTSVLLHALNTALVFLLLRGLTGALWRSVLVAVLFGWHPLHVESVAWIAERKDVLSAFFGLLALMAYARYAQGNEEGRMQNAEMGKTPHASRSALHAPRPRLHVSRFTFHASRFYLLSLLLFSLGLMSKAMLVTLPFVMLLLDYWPLRRLELSTLNPQPSTTLRLLWEKTPFFLLALAASAVTLVVQRQSGALAAGEALSLGTRSQNALVAYVLYLGKLVCPTGLGVFYWHPGQWPLGGLLLSGGVILAVSALAWVQRRRQPYLLMGWLWYCGMLVPVSQVVQTGGHAMADRYTYLPSLGLLILVVWGLCELTRGWRPRVPALAVASGVAIILCVALTRHQIDYWRDSETLFRHDLEVTANNFMAHNNLGGALHQSGRLDEASREFQEAVRLNPDYAESRHNLGTVLYQLNRLPEAVSQLQEAIRLQPDHARAHNNLGLAFYRQGNTAEATAQFLEALRIDPGYADPRKNLDVVLGANPLGSPLPGTPAGR